MILVTHGIIGAAVGRLFPGKPLLAFIVGFISHLLTDAIPHWHYRLFSETRDPQNPMNNDMVIGRKFLMDLVDIGIDAAAGIVFSILLFQGWSGFSAPDISIIAGAIGAIIPDAFHFLYMKFRREPFYSFQKLHTWIHSKIDIDDLHLIGIGSQVVIIIAAVLLSRGIL